MGCARGTELDCFISGPYSLISLVAEEPSRQTARQAGVVASFPTQRRHTNRATATRSEFVQPRQEQCEQRHTKAGASGKSAGRQEGAIHGIVVVLEQHTEAPAWDRDASFAGRPPPSKQRSRRILLAALLCLASARLEWLSGDAQAAAGMRLRLPASHTRNRCPIIRLARQRLCSLLTTLLHMPPFLRCFHHHSAQTGPCLAVPCTGGHGQPSAVIAASHRAPDPASIVWGQRLWAP
ncbi:hypothetical protein EK21DRAFT_93068 [Setomelanomma holmii]|uniref:Uncharacterized protein n=1 Tax=Setomelanomma holmii TaxID=210430 RepID=A0A9P4H146_9PLEO|nr:hypothetical protein EK21DRAFT_93068 [Setomelanomma holmii]